MHILRLIFLVLGAQALVDLGESANMVHLNISKKVHPQDGPQKQPLTSYYANIGVGTPSKEFKMLVDINSRENWLPHYSPFGLLLGRLNYKNGYAKKYSSSAVKENDVYMINYHGTELSGKRYEDVFELRNVTQSSSAPRFRQRFLAISSASNDYFSRRHVDGVIAINPFPISITNSDLMSVNLARANLIGELIVGLSLDQDLDSDFGGELTLGGFNQTKFIGPLRYHPTINNIAWELNMTGVMLGHLTIGCADACTALISTSTNDIYGPPEQVKKVLKFFGYPDVDHKFDENRLYDIDCQEVIKAPNITFFIDSRYYSLHPSAYIRKKTEGVLFKSQGCYIAILSSGSSNKWELGTNFVSNYYTVFDINLRRVAFAQRTQSNTRSHEG